MQKLLSTLWALLRPQTYILLLTYVLFGLSYGLSVQLGRSAPYLPSGLPYLLALAVSLGFWYIAGTAFNDYADYEIDKINLKKDKQRPLVMGLVNKKQLFNIGVTASLVSIVLSVATRSLPITVLVFIMVLLNIAYSLPPFKISRRGGLAPLLLPLGYIVLTVLSGMKLSGLQISFSAGMVLLGMYLHFLSRIALKDHRDVVGDKKLGKKTLVIKYGNKWTILLVAFLFTLSTLILVASLWRVVNVGALYIALFASGAVAILKELYHEERWLYQKPLITMYGRLCSGIVTILIFCFLVENTSLSDSRKLLAMAVIASVFFWSLIDIKKLQQPARGV